MHLKDIGEEGVIDMAYIVYCHTNIINGKQYIGITSKSLEYRCGIDGTRYRNCVAFWNAIQKYGWENFSHKILAHELTREQACELEIYYIKKFNTLAPNGYNLSPDGDACGSTPELREYMSKVMKGNKNCVGRKWTKSQTEKMSNFMKGNNYGKINIERYGKPLSQYTLQGDFIKEFPSLNEASRVTGIARNIIRGAVTGKFKQAGGYIWKRRGN